MDEQKQSLNYARLVNRQKFYKEKSLKLEKDFIFAQEKLSTLEKELKTLQEQSKTADQESKILQTEFSSLKTNYDALLDKYNQEKKKNAEKLADYEQRMEMLEKNQRADDDMSRETYAQRVAGYERLLTDMQNEMSEREKLIAVYRRRITVLEKRLQTNGGKPALKVKADLQDAGEAAEQKSQHRAIVYTNYALILDQKRSLIRGSLTIENIGEDRLVNPMVCFRFSPEDAAELKGRIYTIDDLDESGEGPLKWIFLENDWSEEAKERGEIWIHPLQDAVIEPGHSLAVDDFQVQLEHIYYDHVSIECFVFFQDNDYKVKSANQILINL